MNLQGAPTPVQGGVIAQPVGVQPVGVQPMQPPIQQVVPQPVQQYQQPMQPVQQPMQPVQQPMQPVQQPMQPVQQPTQPVVATGPSRPVNRVRPTQPRTPPPPPVTSRITSSSTNTGGSSGGGSGFLSISTRPASRCTVAGQTFSTPRLRLALPAGTHRVQCSNPDFNVSSTFSVTIRDGQETREINHPLE
jgi:hypothetical protein